MRKRYVRSSDGIFDFVDEKVLSDDDVLESLNDLHERSVFAHEKNIILQSDKDNVESILQDFMNVCNDLQADPLNDHLLDAVRDMLWYMDVELK